MPAFPPARREAPMAAPQTTADLIDLVRKARLLPEDRLRGYDLLLATISDPPPSPAAPPAGRTGAGLRTPLQGGLLPKGKWRNFVRAGKYKLLEHIGTGGRGQVFLCEHIRMGRGVAIKIPPADKAAEKVSR